YARSTQQKFFSSRIFRSNYRRDWLVAGGSARRLSPLQRTCRKNGRGPSDSSLLLLRHGLPAVPATGPVPFLARTHAALHVPSPGSFLGRGAADRTVLRHSHQSHLGPVAPLAVLLVRHRHRLSRRLALHSLLCPASAAPAWTEQQECRDHRLRPYRPGDVSAHQRGALVRLSRQ